MSRIQLFFGRNFYKVNFTKVCIFSCVLDHWIGVKLLTCTTWVLKLVMYHCSIKTP